MEVTTADGPLCSQSFISILYLPVSQSQRDMNALWQNLITCSRVRDMHVFIDSSHSFKLSL